MRCSWAMTNDTPLSLTTSFPTILFPVWRLITQSVTFTKQKPRALPSLTVLTCTSHN